MNEFHGTSIHNTSSSLSYNLESLNYPLPNNSFDPLPLSVDNFDLPPLDVGGFPIIFPLLLV
jgi:hypothetical protein